MKRFSAKTKEPPKQKRGTHAVEFLKDLRPEGGAVTITAITPDGPTTTRTFTDLEEARKFILKHNDDYKRNIYYTSALTKQAMNIKPKKADVTTVCYLHVDIDPRDDESPEDFKARMLPRIEAHKPAPTLIIDSGNGLQALWELEEPVSITAATVIADIEARNYALATAFDADPATRNIDRLLRVPGTTKYPNEKKREVGRTECRTRYLSGSDKSYPLSAFPAAGEPPGDDRSQHQHDESGSGYGWRFMRDCRRGGLDYEAAKAAILADAGKAGEWARRVDERQLRRAWDNQTSASTTHSWDDPDISLLDDRRGELPDFPLETLDSTLRQTIERVAAGAGTTPDHVVVPLIGIASSLIGTQRRIRASASWSQPLTQWTVVVDYSGGGKTPGLEATKNALDQIAEQQQSAVAELRRAHEARAEAAKAARAEWKAAVEEAHEKHQPPPSAPEAADDPGAFIAPRLYVTNVTIERVAQLLTARPQGMLFISDELAGWFANMSRYSGGDDKQFWLVCWDGGAYNVERVTKPPISIQNLLVGIVGGLQPDKLADCFAGAADGIYARFLFAWPGRAPFRELADNPEIDDDILEILRRLISLRKPEQPMLNRIALSAEAREVFEALRKNVYGNTTALEGRARDWWSKVPAHALRLAGALVYLRWGLLGDEEPREIAGEFMRSAQQLILAYFWPHAQACLRQIGLTQRHADARRVLRWLKAKQPEYVKREEIRQNALSKNHDADGTEEILQYLARAGWLRRQQLETGGRPAVRWQVNPKLWEEVA